MLRAGADMGKAQITKDLRDVSLAIDNPEAFLDHSFQINPAPANDAVCLGVRAGLHKAGQFAELLWRQSAYRSIVPAVQQPLGAVRIETMNPVSQRLAIHPARSEEHTSELQSH